MTQLNCLAPFLPGVDVLQTSTATAAAFAVAVDALANPGPLLELPSHNARVVNFILAFFPGIPAQSLNCNLKVLILVSALISEIYTSPKLMVEILVVPSSVNVDVQVPISTSVVTVRPILSVAACEEMVNSDEARNRLPDNP